MKRHWRVCRQTVAHPDATRRWDQAYQSILQWSLETQRKSKPQREREEMHHAGRSLCSGLDFSAGQTRDD